MYDSADVLPAKYKQITQSFKKDGISMFTKIIHIVFIVPVDVHTSGTENENKCCSNFTSHGVIKKMKQNV